MTADTNQLLSVTDYYQSEYNDLMTKIRDQFSVLSVTHTSLQNLDLSNEENK